MVISSELVRAPCTHVLGPDAQPQPATSAQSVPQVKAPQFGPLGAAAGAKVAGAAVAQMPRVISEPVVRPPRMQPFAVLDHPHLAPQFWAQVNWLQPSLGAGVSARVGAGVNVTVVDVVAAVQIPMIISELAVRPPLMQPPLFLDQPHPSPASSWQSAPQVDKVHTEVGVGLGLGLGGVELGGTVCGVAVVIIVGPAVRQFVPKPAEHEPSS